MLHLICNFIKNFNSYRRETLWQVSSYRRRPYIYDFIIVRLINKPASQKYPCQIYLLKLTILVTDTLGFKGFANLILKSSLFILFCETDADFHQVVTFIL